MVISGFKDKLKGVMMYFTYLNFIKYSTATLNKYISTFLQATCVARNDNPASFDPFSVEVNSFITFQFETQTRWSDLS